jgi:membrane dipeptidase
MIIFDAHCDTALELYLRKKDLYSSDCHNDIKRMKKQQKFVQTFAVFVDPDDYMFTELRNAIEILENFISQTEKYNAHINICRSYSEIIETLNQDKIAGLISIENGGALQGSLSALRIFYRLGVRSICLVWNNRNEIADGVGDLSSGGGLTDFGRKVVKKMNDLGMIVDVSHMTEKGFWDVIEVSRSPIIASHSNSKAICNHNRNLTDQQIMAVKSNNGVIGINLYPYFLNESGNASIDDVIKHIEHISSLAGPEIVGLGADFDGIEKTPEGIKGVEDIHKIFERLGQLNYTDEFIEGFAGKNFLRVVKEVL